jgi:hypothetical protein
MIVPTISQTHCIILLLYLIVVQFQITLMHVNVGYKPCLVKNLCAHICMLSFEDIDAF